MSAETMQDIWDSMTDKQKLAAMAILDDAIQHSDESDSNETIRDVINSMDEKQKWCMAMLVEQAIDDSDDDEEDEEDEEEEVKHSSLKHYGVIGMKWGLRKYQNPDGSLTPEGRERYNSGNMYKSHGTKRLEKRVAKLEKKTSKMKAQGKDTTKVEKKLKKKAERLETSRIMDKSYLDYAQKTSYGKAALQNLVFGPFGARGYQQSRAMGYGRIVSAILGVQSSSDLGNQIVRATTRKTITEYANGRDPVKKAREKIKEFDRG
jgi:hypothetical protein